MAGVVTLAHGQARPPAVRAPRTPASAAPLTPAVAAPVATGALPTAVPPPPSPPTAPFRPTSDATSAPTTTEAAAQFRAPGGGVTIGLQEADLPDLVNWIGGLTGKRFIYGSKMKSLKVTLYSPTPVTVAEAYRAFLVALETNGLTVVPHGRFLKIIETQGVSTETTPIYGAAQPVPAEDRYVTRLYRLQHVGADEVSQVLTKFKSKEGEIVPYGGGNLLIITDTGSNIRRMLQLVEEIDVGSSGEQIWVEPVHYVTPSELAARLNDLFDIKAGGGAPAGGGGGGRGGNQPASVSGSGGGGSTEVRVTKIVPDDRAKSLIIVASERAYMRMLEVIKRVDVPPTTGDGDIHVLPLQHAMADELAPVLNQILGGAGGAIPGAPGGANRPPGAPATPTPTPGVTGAGGQLPLGIFEGAVRITADKSTNSVIVTSSLRDYAQIRNVIDKLDQPRRQVFIEAVVMDVSTNDSDRLSVSYHGGAVEKIAGGGNSLIYGGLNPLSTIGFPNPNELNGLALGVRGPTLSGSTNLLGTGISVPAFGVLINALATSSNANVLATPHIIATDNTPAEINVGQNIPLQTNAAGFGNLAGLGGLGGGQAAGALGALGGLGGLGGFGAAPRTDVGTKIKVTPHMNDSNEVRLELQEEISEQGASPSGTLGAVSINKRTANTSVVVKDQQTVVIGGLVRDAYTNTVDKIPLLGDIPVLGVLFRKTQNTKSKSNLLLILTPYVIRDQQDLRAVFERKMQERQEFLDRYFVFSDQRPYEVPKDFARLNGLLEDIRQANLSNDERRRLSDATKPRERKTHEPTTPLEMPDIVRPPSGGAGGTTVQAPGEGGGRGGGRGRDTVPAGGQAPRSPAVLTPGNRGAPAPRRE